MNLIESEYKRFDTSSVSLFGGTKPDTMTVTTSGTNASVTFDTDHSGRAFMQTGATAGNSAAIELPEINLNRYTALSFDVSLILSQNTVVRGDAVFYLGLHAPSTSPTTNVYHIINQVNNQNFIRDVGPTTSTNIPTRDVLQSGVLFDSEIAISESPARIIHRTQNTLAITTPHENTSAHRYIPRIYLETKTDTACSVSVTRADIKYYQER